MLWRQRAAGGLARPGRLAARCVALKAGLESKARGRARAVDRTQQTGHGLRAPRWQQAVAHGFIAPSPETLCSGSLKYSGWKPTPVEMR